MKYLLKKSRINGFTLIEILIALFIFTILALFIADGLKSLLQSQSRVEKKTKDLAQLQFAFLLLKQDIEQTVNRPAMNINGELNGFIGSSTSIKLTRTGLVNPENQFQRPTLQRLEYIFSKNNLIRMTWPLPDQTAKSIPSKRFLLNKIKYFKFSFLDDKGYFYDKWPPATGSHLPLPAGVRIVLKTQFFGKITQLYLIPGHTFVFTQ